MLILISDAVANFDMTEANLYNDRYLRKLIVKTDEGCKIDAKAVSDHIKAKQDKEDFCYEMTFFAEWLKKYIGVTAFNEPFSRGERNLISQGLKERLSFARAKAVELSWWDKYKTQYQKYIDSDSDIVFSHHTIRKPLTKKYIKEHYWQLAKTITQISNELNVPSHWVYKEITRLGLGKLKNGVKVRGRKGWKAPDSYKVARQNQPHRKAVVSICPRTFKIIKEYRSICSV